MDSIKINTGAKRIAINDDPERVLEFNPSDVAFAEKFYQLVKDFEEKQRGFEARAKSMDAQPADLDDYGLPANVSEKLAFVREVCEYLYGKIDYLFGAGASQKIFGGVLSLEAVSQFFEGITPFIEATRREKVSKYTSHTSGTGKHVMK